MKMKFLNLKLNIIIIICKLCCYYSRAPIIQITKMSRFSKKMYVYVSTNEVLIVENNTTELIPNWKKNKCDEGGFSLVNLSIELICKFVHTINKH